MKQGLISRLARQGLDLEHRHRFDSRLGSTLLAGARAGRSTPRNTCAPALAGVHLSAEVRP
jgi:hypothetical protein